MSHSGNINGAVSSNVVCSGDHLLCVRQLSFFCFNSIAPKTNPGTAWVTALSVRLGLYFSVPLNMMLTCTSVMYIGIGIITTLISIYMLRKENARRERGERDEIIRGVTDVGDDKVPVGKGKVYDSLEQVKREKGDAWSGYRYTL